MKVAEALQDVSRIFLDSAPVIYYFEKNPTYHRVIAAIFAEIDAGTIKAVTGPVTLAECLVQPYRLGQTTLQKEFADFIVSGRNTLFTNIDQNITMQATDLRARYNIALLDALQFGVALATGCDTFLTNDTVLRRVTELKIVIVGDLEL